jgi:hypothetical protein
MNTFNLPDLGEGLPEAEIVAWHVAEGDAIKADELLLSVETAKAVVEVPLRIPARSRACTRWPATSSPRAPRWWISTMPGPPPKPARRKPSRRAPMPAPSSAR